MNAAPDTAGARRARRLARGGAVLTTAGALVLSATPAIAMTDLPRSASRAAASSTTPLPAKRTAAGSSDEKPAVVGPLLDFFGFGAAIGLPLACQAGTSAVGSGAGEAGLAEQAGPYIAMVNDGCDTASTRGSAFVDKGRKLSQPLNAINPYANTVIEMGARAAEQYGAEYGETLAPFGPTIQGSGATLRWLEGR